MFPVTGVTFSDAGYKRKTLSYSYDYHKITINIPIDHHISGIVIPMIPENQQNNQICFRIGKSTLIGVPSPAALRSDKFPGVNIGSDPVIGKHCIIFGNTFIGDRFQCGDHVLIRDNTSIGDGVTVGNGSFIDSDVVVADHVTIGNDVHISPSTWIDRHVVVGARVHLLADTHIECMPNRKTRGIILEAGCIIGEGVVISPGVCVGAGAKVEAGTRVTRDVPPDPERITNRESP